MIIRIRKLTAAPRNWKDLAAGFGFLAFLSFAAACAGPGSGSSGLSERGAIRSAQESGTCSDFEGVGYCPTDVEDVAPMGEEIDTAFDNTGVLIECFDLGPDDFVCDFALTFIPSDFDEDTEFILATRGFDTDEMWEVDADVDLMDVADIDGPLGQASPDINPANPGEESIQAAFVAIDPGMARGPTPAQVETLGELGSDLVFVSPEVPTELKPVPDEDAVIAEALSTGTCVDGGLQDYCPTDTVFPPCPPVPGVGPEVFFYESDATVNFAEGAPYSCVVNGPTTCTFELVYSIDGLIELFYTAAARVVTEGMNGPENGLWRLGPEIMEFPYDEDPEVRRDIPVPVVVEIPEGFDRDDPDARLPIQVALMPDPIKLDEVDLTDGLILQGGFVIFVTEVAEIKVVEP